MAKLIVVQLDNFDYGIHYRLLNLYVRMGFKITKVYRAIFLNKTTYAEIKFKLTLTTEH